MPEDDEGQQDGAQETRDRGCREPRTANVHDGCTVVGALDSGARQWEPVLERDNGVA